MAFGTLGSTLNDELNRLANGGTYRDMDDMVDEALAAKQWANRENIVPYSTDTVGILNEIAALGPNRQNWFDFNGVCNYLAGTTGLPAAAALRQITTTGDILTSLAAFYTDAATPRYNYPGYIRLDGTLGNYILVPDENALDITGDLDLRIKLAADAYTTSGAFQTLIAKTDGGSNQSYGFGILNTGVIRLFWSATGSAALSADSTVATGLTNGSTKWIRATLDVNNGAGGRDIKFFLSDNGTTWTQLGTTVTQAGTTSIFASTRALEIGSQGGGGSSVAGNIFNAQVYASIDGTDKRLDVDLTTNVTSATYDQFAATTGQLCTINGQNTLTNGGSAGSLLPVTVGSSLAADSNDPKFLAHDGTNYVYVPGVAGNYISVPDSNALDITGDIDLRVQVALDDWTPAANSILIGKWSTAFQRSFQFYVGTDGKLYFVWSGDGQTSGVTTAASTVATGIADGTTKWVRFTLDNLASTVEYKFFTSDDGTNWTQLGTTITGGGPITMFSGTSFIEIGARSAGTDFMLAGKVYRAQIYSDVTETTKVLDVDTSVITTGAATSFTALTGQTVTINRSTSGRKTVAVTQPTWLFGTDDYMEVNNRYMAHSTSDENYVYLSGASGNYMSVSDAPPLDVTGDLDVQVRVAMDDWTPSSDSVLIAKRVALGSEISFIFYLQTNGRPALVWSANGTVTIAKSATAAPTVTDGATLWVRTTLDVDNGASGNTVTFFTSTDGTTWTQLGSPVVTAGTTSIFSSTSPLEIGAQATGTNSPAKGKFYRAIIKNGIDGTTVLDANAAVITLPSQTTFTDSSSNAYTVTINKSGVGTFVSTGNYLYLPGIASNFASAPDSAVLDITGDIDLRCKVAMDDWTPSATQHLVSKFSTAALGRSYQLQLNTTGTLSFQYTTDGNTNILLTSTASVSATDGSVKWVRGTRASGTGVVKFFTSDDGLTWTQLGTDVAGVSGSMYASTTNLEIGSVSNGTTANSRGKFFRAQVLNGIGGTLAFDANFENSITSLNQASFTESSSNAATVTINRSGSTYRSAGVIDAGYLYPGATNTFSNSTTDFLNFGATDSFTALVVTRNWTTLNGAGRFMNKESGGGYRILDFTSSGAITDGTNTVGTATANQISGGLEVWGFITNRSTNVITGIFNGLGSGTSISTVGSLSNIGTLRIGTTSAGTLFANTELMAAAVFRTVLTPAQIRQVTNYFANREAYL